MAAALITVVTPEAASAQSSATMQPAAFATELERIAAVIASGEPGAVPNIRLPSVWIVETGGQRFETPALWLRTALDRARREPAIWPSRRAALLAQLAALKVEAESLAALTEGDERGPDAAAARSALAGVLAGPEFRHMAQQSAMTRLRQRFTQWLLRIWQRLGGNRLGRRGTAMAFAWVAAFLALGALTTWLVRLIRRPDGGQRLALTQPPRRRRSAGAWAREALLAADPRESSRYA